MAGEHAETRPHAAGALRSPWHQAVGSLGAVAAPAAACPAGRRRAAAYAGGGGASDTLAETHIRSSCSIGAPEVGGRHLGRSWNGLRDVSSTAATLPAQVDSIKIYRPCSARKLKSLSKGTVASSTAELRCRTCRSAAWDGGRWEVAHGCCIIMYGGGIPPPYGAEAGGAP